MYLGKSVLCVRGAKDKLVNLEENRKSFKKKEDQK